MFEGLGVVVALALFVLYFLPSIVAENRRKHTGTAGVVLVNLFFGWTLIGWLVAFVWACSGKTDRDVKAEQKRHDDLIAALRGAQQPAAEQAIGVRPDQLRVPSVARPDYWERFDRVKLR